MGCPNAIANKSPANTVFENRDYQALWVSVAGSGSSNTLCCLLRLCEWAALSLAESERSNASSEASYKENRGNSDIHFTVHG